MDTLASRTIAVHRYDLTTKTIGMLQVSCVVNQAAR